MLFLLQYFAFCALCFAYLLFVVYFIAAMPCYGRQPEPSGEALRGHRRGEAQRAESGVGFLGRGSGERCKLLSGVRGGASAAEKFSCILCRQIASLGTPVRAAYSLWG